MTPDKNVLNNEIEMKITNDPQQTINNENQISEKVVESIGSNMLNLGVLELIR